MRKNSDNFLHRILLLGVLAFGATVLLLNALIVVNSESNILLTDMLPGL